MEKSRCRLNRSHAVVLVHEQEAEWEGGQLVKAASKPFLPHITLSHPVHSFFDVICRVPVWQTGGGRVVKSWSVLKPHGATRRDWHACRVGRWQLGNTTRKVAWQLCSSTRWGTSVMSKLSVFQWPKLDVVDPSHWKSGQFLMSPHLNFLF